MNSAASGLQFLSGPPASLHVESFTRLPFDIEKGVGVVDLALDADGCGNSGHNKPVTQSCNSISGSAAIPGAVRLEWQHDPAGWLGLA